MVRVGNRRRNLLTRWQALEYLTQIGVERTAQDVMGAISIVPGACAAWRKTAIHEVGDYPKSRSLRTAISHCLYIGPVGASPMMKRSPSRSTETVNSLDPRGNSGGRSAC